MTIELLYTSAAQGLKQGSRGFCTVVCTAGLPINLAQRLESLSGYRHLYQPGDELADRNPVCHSHLKLVVGGKSISVLSRIAAYGVDYSQRTNKLAHHVVLDGPLPLCGPAAILSQPSFMREGWDGRCETLANGPMIPPIELTPKPCSEWQRITGDAGWAGVVANAWLQPPGKPIWIIFSESQSRCLLDLICEATAILPPPKRWQATFSTYCTNLPPDVDCRVRCVIAGSDEARMAIARGTVIDLTSAMPNATTSPASEAARDGGFVGERSKAVAIHEAVTYLPESSELKTVAVSGNTQIENDYRIASDDLESMPPAIRGAKFKNRNGHSEPPVFRKKIANQRLLLIFVCLAPILVILGGVAGYYTLTGSKPKLPTETTTVVEQEEKESEARPDLDENDVEVNSQNSQIIQNEQSPKSVAQSIVVTDLDGKLLPSEPVKILSGTDCLVLSRALYKVKIDPVAEVPPKFEVRISNKKSDCFSIDNGVLYWKDGMGIGVQDSAKPLELEIVADSLEITPQILSVPVKIVPYEELSVSLESLNLKEIQSNDFIDGTILRSLVKTKENQQVESKEFEWVWERTSPGNKDTWTPIPGKSSSDFTVGASQHGSEIRCTLNLPGQANHSDTKRLFPLVMARVSTEEILKNPSSYKVSFDVSQASFDLLQKNGLSWQLTTESISRLKGERKSTSDLYSFSIPLPKTLDSNKKLREWVLNLQKAKEDLSQELKSFDEAFDRLLRIASQRRFQLEKTSDVSLAFTTRKVALSKFTPEVHFLEQSMRLNKLLFELKYFVATANDKNTDERPDKYKDLEKLLVATNAGYPYFDVKNSRPENSQEERSNAMSTFEKLFKDQFPVAPKTSLLELWANAIERRNAFAKILLQDRPSFESDIGIVGELKGLTSKEGNRSEVVPPFRLAAKIELYDTEEMEAFLLDVEPIVFPLK